MAGKYERKPEKKPGRAKKIILVVLALVLVVCGGVSLYALHLLNLIERPGSDVQLSDEDLILSGDETLPEGFTGPILSAEDVELATEPAASIYAEHNVNILLVGQDLANGGTRGRADAVILVTINKVTGTVKMTSFLRDMYVQIPGRFPHKFNTSYALGGFELLDNTISHNFGLQVDGNVAVDFSSFEDIVNLLGGVSIDLTASEVEYLNNDCGFDLVEGVNHVDGLTALAYSRIRHLDSDFGRTNRQRTVLMAIVEQCRSLNLLEIMDLLNQILPMISTDLTNAQILSYATELAPILFNCEITTQYIPAEGTYDYSWVDGMSVLTVDLEANQQILHDTLGE